MEQLKDSGFTKTAVVVLVADRPFYEGRSNAGIYKYFRDEHRVYGDLFKPTGETKGKDFISLKGDHSFSWQSLNNKKEYFMIEI